MDQSPERALQELHERGLRLLPVSAVVHAEGIDVGVIGLDLEPSHVHRECQEGQVDVQWGSSLTADGANAG